MSVGVTKSVFNIFENYLVKYWIQTDAEGVRVETVKGFIPKPIIENIDKIMDIVKAVHHVSSVSIAREQKIAQKNRLESFEWGWIRKGKIEVFNFMQ